MNDAPVKKRPLTKNINAKDIYYRWKRRRSEKGSSSDSLIDPPKRLILAQNQCIIAVNISTSGRKRAHIVQAQSINRG